MIRSHLTTEIILSLGRALTDYARALRQDGEDNDEIRDHLRAAVEIAIDAVPPSEP